MTKLIHSIPIAILLAAAPRPAAAAPSCSSNGMAKLHATYTANQAPCTLNADNYYHYYVDINGATATSGASDYSTIVADFAGTDGSGNLKKLTPNRVGACPSTYGACASSFFNGSDPTTFPDNETHSRAHIALVSTITNNNKLAVILAGNPDRPNHYYELAERAALAGYRTIVLSYANFVSPNDCHRWNDQVNGGSWPEVGATPSIDDCMSQVVAFTSRGIGAYSSTYQPVFDWAIADAGGSGQMATTDAIENRLKLVLSWLSANYPSQGWGQFLATSCGPVWCLQDVVWNKVALMGHSMGSYETAYLAQFHQLDRAAMFSGPGPRLELVSGDEVPTFLDLGASVGTPASHQFALISTDDNWTKQLSNLNESSALLTTGSGYDGTGYFQHSGYTFPDSARILISDSGSTSSCGGHIQMAENCGASTMTTAWDWILNHAVP
jgi:hypothetical protein